MKWGLTQLFAFGLSLVNHSAILAIRKFVNLSVNSQRDVFTRSTPIACRAGVAGHPRFSYLAPFEARPEVPLGCSQR